MNINWALIGAWSEHCVPLPFFKVPTKQTSYDLLPKSWRWALKIENHRKYEQQQLRVSYTSVQPRQKYPVRTAIHSTQPAASTATQQRTKATAPILSGLCFPAFEPRRIEFKDISSWCPREWGRKSFSVHFKVWSREDLMCGFNICFELLCLVRLWYFGNIACEFARCFIMLCDFACFYVNSYYCVYFSLLIV